MFKWIGERDRNWSGTWYRNDNVKCDPEFDGNFEAGGRTGNGGVEGAGSGKS